MTERELTGPDATDAITAAFRRLQAPLPLSKDTYTDAVADLFRSRPEVWIDARELMRVGGQCAWRTRVSEVRRHWLAHGWTIQNRVRRLPSGVRVSEYRRVRQEAA